MQRVRLRNGFWAASLIKLTGAKEERGVLYVANG